MFFIPLFAHLQTGKAFENRLALLDHRPVHFCRRAHLVEHADGLAHIVVDQLLAACSSPPGVLLNALRRIHRQQAVQGQTMYVRIITNPFLTSFIEASLAMEFRG